MCKVMGDRDRTTTGVAKRVRDHLRKVLLKLTSSEPQQREAKRSLRQTRIEVDREEDGS
jgi:hypothetical protein